MKLLTLSQDDYWLSVYRHANLQYMTIKSIEEGDSIHLMWVSFWFSVFTCEYYCIETLMVYRILWVSVLMVSKLGSLLFDANCTIH